MTPTIGTRRPLISAAVILLFVDLLLGLTPLRDRASRHATAVLMEVSRAVVTSDSLARTEVGFVLNGKLPVRSHAAAWLYRHGYIRSILLVSIPDARFRGPYGPPISSSEMLALMIEREGVPADAIQAIPAEHEVSTTRDEVRALRDYLEAHPIPSLTVATTDYHSGRTRRVLEQELAGLNVSIRMAAFPDNNGIGPTNWWRRWDGVRTYSAEFLKLIATRYGF